MKRDLGERVCWPLMPWFWLFLQPSCNFSLFLVCRLFKPSLYINSQHIHHWYSLVRVGFVSLANKRIPSKTEGFSEEVKFELTLKG